MRFGEKIRRRKPFSNFSFSPPPHFTQQSFTCFSTTIEFSRENTMVLGKQIKDCWGKKWGVRKNEKRRMWISSLTLVNNNHHLQCVSYLYKLCRLVKNSLKWCKNSSFKVEDFKIFRGGSMPPCHPPPSRKAFLSVYGHNKIEGLIFWYWGGNIFFGMRRLFEKMSQILKNEVLVNRN